MSRILTAVIFSLCLAAPTAIASQRGESKFKKHDGGAHKKWIVVFSEGVSGEKEARKLAKRYGARLRYVYTNAINGFAVEMDETAAMLLSMDSEVALVEQEGIVAHTAVQTGTATDWGLGAIDQRGGYDWSYTYNRTGVGVRAYIIDSGISSGDEFSGGSRLIDGYTVQCEAYVRKCQTFTGCINVWKNIDCLEDVDEDGDPVISPKYPVYEDHYCASSDCHGSKVASIVAGSLYGVAKEATIINVKVTSPIHGSASDVIRGLDWVIADRNAHPSQSAVANMSLSLDGNQVALNQAVINTIDSGVVVVAGAGNTPIPPGPSNGTLACGASPGLLGSTTWATSGWFYNPNARTTITVGATSPNGSRAINAVAAEYMNSDEQSTTVTYWTSDYGSCVDIFAPGDGVRARGVAGTTDQFSGTSASSPYVAGVVAQYLEGRGSNYDPNAVEAALKANATPNVLTNVGTGSPNLFIYSRVDLWP